MEQKFLSMSPITILGPSIKSGPISACILRSVVYIMLSNHSVMIIYQETKTKLAQEEQQK